MTPAERVLVGRAAELDAFGAALDELGRGNAGAIEVVGEPGIGKTRLLTELAARAEADGCLVLTGSASELESDLPFGVFVDALDEFVQAMPPRSLEAFDDDTRSRLAQVFPSLQPVASPDETASPQERYRIHRSVRALLEGLTALKPLVLVLDDLHWADSASAELVGALLRQRPAGPVLLAMGVRPRQVPDRLAAALERAARAAVVVRLELESLTRDEARELLGGGIGEAAASLLHDESGGNPFYLEQLARSLGRPSSPAAERDVPLDALDVPRSVAEALAAELAGLSEEARLVLEGAAVAGDPFEPERAASAAGTSIAEALDALDELLRLDFVRPTDVPRRFRFRHPLVRRAVYESTPGGWRLAAHDRCARELAARGASPAMRAHHVERSAVHGDLEAVATLRAAGDDAAHRTPATSARWYGAALRLLPDSAPVDERVELLLARAGGLSATGAFAASHASLIESIGIVPVDAQDLRVRLTIACARIEHLLGRRREARARLESALAELEDPASPLAVELMIDLAADEIYRTAPGEGREWARRAVAAASRAGDPVLTASALAVHAAAAALSGATAEARKSSDDATEIVDRLHDDLLAPRLDTLARLATAEFYLDRLEAAARHAERALAVGRATGHGDIHPAVYSILSPLLWLQGRLRQAEEVSDDVVEAARLLDNAHALAWALVNRSSAAFAAGDLELALATAAESRDLVEDLEEGLVSVAVAVTLAATLFELGQPERAAELLLTPAGEAVQLSASGWAVRILELLTRSLLATGRRADAERFATAAARRADQVQLNSARAMADRARAALAVDAGNPMEAAELTLGAAVALEEVGDLFDAARTRALAGQALALAGDADRAAEQFELAAASFDSFGAPRYRAEVEQELRKLGRTIHRRTAAGTADSGLASLTERELELARHVVERKTNPQIAAELYLSQKTVETHLRNIFRKVGVANRVELARAVEQVDRAENAQSLT